MHDPRLARLAHVLVRYSVAVKPGDRVVISGNAVAEPAVTEVYRAVLRAGGHPWVHLTSNACKEALLREGSVAQVGYTNPLEKHYMTTANVYITFWADENTRFLSDVDPAHQVLASKARKPILTKFLKRLARPAGHKDRCRWVGTLFPTQGHAQDAEMSLADYSEFVFTAGKLDARDPIAAWKKAGVAQQRLADRLNKAREIRIRTDNGTDIRFGVAGRTWINCDGRENFPDGEVFTSPHETATAGTVCYSFPAVAAGREVNGIRLTFKGGKVVDASADKNEDFLIQMLDQDKGARVLGELALGTNYGIRRFTRNTLFDEKIGGTFHLAVGASLPESGGKNESGLHWDMVSALRDGGIVEADGEVISRRGKFTKPTWPR